MRVDQFDFELPENLIALRPAAPRRSSRLLQVEGAALSDHRVEDLPSLLRPGDMLVFNDTRVIPARLFGLRRREQGAEVAVEVTLVTREDGATWSALARPGKRLRAGDVLWFNDLSATVVSRGEGGFVTLRFDRSAAALDEAVARIGVMPLPPYIAARRAADARDAQDYQTVFAERPGAVAAPTAALHFDAPLLAALAERGVLSARVTLHVGAGTFLPVKAEDTARHRMHSEEGEITAETVRAIEEARAAGGRIIAVGTTALRVLETAARGGKLRPWRGSTDIFITPGYHFLAIDGLMTNFHLPRSTLFMLVSAAAGLQEMQSAYAHAIQKQYRFYSYGDSSLIWVAPPK